MKGKSNSFLPVNRSVISFRLKGFTLLELIISMIISSIVIVAAYYLTVTLGHYQVMLIKNKTQISETVRFVSWFEKDFQTASTAFQTPEGIVMETHNQKIIYEFRSEFILRKLNDVVDTLAIKTSDVRTEFESGSALVNKINFQATSNKTNLPFEFNKIYTAESKMKAIINYPVTNP